MQEIAGAGFHRHLGARKARRGIGHCHLHLAQRAHRQKLLPGGRGVAQPVDATAPGDDTARNGQRPGGAQDAVADDAGGDGRAADDVGQIAGGSGGAGRGQLMARETRDIGGDVGIRNAQRQHRLIMADQKRAADRACGRHRHQHIERAAGVADRPGHFPGRSDIARDPTFRRHGPTRHAGLLARDLHRAGQAQKCGRLDRGRRAQVGRILGQRSARLGGQGQKAEHQQQAQKADHARQMAQSAAARP